MELWDQLLWEQYLRGMLLIADVPQKIAHDLDLWVSILSIKKEVSKIGSRQNKKLNKQKLDSEAVPCKILV